MRTRDAIVMVIGAMDEAKKLGLARGGPCSLGENGDRVYASLLLSGWEPSDDEIVAALHKIGERCDFPAPSEEVVRDIILMAREVWSGEARKWAENLGLIGGDVCHG